MTDNAQAQKNTQPNTASPSGMRGEIEQKWGKFSHQEIRALKDNADLVTQVQSKYSLDHEEAKREVDAFANGRQL
ncbi:hypothetical protein [Filomicrobium sp.]|uniref:hypothetical protein n=1 Tax=Filomicrobium sp. TaxID=2024831 RepID=UPI002585EADC|nr:hypothetical protein [Filomicrobium sp.]MCV0369934.1 hypothetical protein [Filomicrobium sp.]